VPGFELSRLAVPQARVRRVIGTCYAIWKVPPNGYGRSPQSPRRERLVKALARPFARTRAASAQRRHRYRSGPKASGTGCALQLRFRRFWDSNGRRGQRHKVGGKCGSPAVGCRLPNKQLPEFWDCSAGRAIPFFSAFVCVFGCCSKRQCQPGARFRETFSNGCSLGPDGCWRRTLVRHVGFNSPSVAVDFGALPYPEVSGGKSWSMYLHKNC